MKMLGERIVMGHIITLVCDSIATHMVTPRGTGIRRANEASSRFKQSARVLADQEKTSAPVRTASGRWLFNSSIRA
jgi:hypothetical protein